MLVLHPLLQLLQEGRLLTAQTLSGLADWLPLGGIRCRFLEVYTVLLWWRRRRRGGCDEGLAASMHLHSDTLTTHAPVVSSVEDDIFTAAHGCWEAFTILLVPPKRLLTLLLMLLLTLLLTLLLMLLLLLLKRLLGRLYGTGPRSVSQINGPTALLLLPVLTAPPLKLLLPR